MEDFRDYCKKKKIDPDLFQKEEPEKYRELKNIFDQVHPKSFTEQKKFLINDLRRTYHYQEVADIISSSKEPGTTRVSKPVVKKKPAVKIKPKPKKP